MTFLPQSLLPMSSSNVAQTMKAKAGTRENDELPSVGENGWSTLKHHFFQAQDWCTPKSKKSEQGGQRPLFCPCAHGETQRQEESLQNVEKGPGHLGGIQERCQGLQG